MADLALTVIAAAVSLKNDFMTPIKSLPEVAASDVGSEFYENTKPRAHWGVSATISLRRFGDIGSVERAQILTFALSP